MCQNQLPTRESTSESSRQNAQQRGCRRSAARIITNFRRLYDTSERGSSDSGTHFIVVFSIITLLPRTPKAQLIRGLICITLNDLLDKPWSAQVSSIPPPRHVPSLLSRIGSSIPTFARFLFLGFLPSLLQWRDKIRLPKTSI